MRHFRYKFISIGILIASASAAVHAQSSVTLYGSLDESIAYYNNTGGHSLVAMQSGNNAATYWGLKGKEDLGGGVNAIFTLESSFDITHGSLSNNRLFAHQSTVGLSGDSYGTLAKDI